MSTLLVITTLFCSFWLNRACVPSATRLDSIAASPLLGSIIIIAGANFLGPLESRPLLSGLCTAVGLLVMIGCLKWSKDSYQAPKFWWGQGVVLLLIGLYVCYAQFRFLDTDNWIHEPLIAGYTLGIFPPVHPFFPEAVMNGHYGRDLLIGTILNHGVDPLIVVWLLNPIMAISSAWMLMSLLARCAPSRGSALMGTVFCFFGICVGFRVGLIDTADGNNGVVYALCLYLFVLMLDVLGLGGAKRPSHPGLWLLAGFVLGTYQLVYETHFGLLLLTAAIMLIPAYKMTDKPKKLFTGVAVTAILAVTLASVEGGPITDIVQSKAFGTRAVSGTADDKVSDLNVEQHVSIKFPKKALFQVRATAASYQRISVGFQDTPFRSLIGPIEGEGYLFIFSPKFLTTHWLPLFLCPFTLAWCLRKRSWAGLSFWCFGAWSYLIPGLVDFGPVYEWEYFRWEYAAGFAWAVPLGLMCGDLLTLETEEKPPIYKDEAGWNFHLRTSHKRLVAGLVIAVLGLLPAEKLINRAIIDIQKNGIPSLAPSYWRIGQKDLGVGKADIKIASALSQVIQKDDRVLTDLGNETPFGLWPDCVLSALTGARISGRARPPVDRRVHAHPNYHRSPLWKILTQTGRLDPLIATDIDWIVTDPSNTSLDKHLGTFPYATLQAEETDSEGNVRKLWKLDIPDTLGPSQVAAQPPFEVEFVSVDETIEPRTATLSKVRWILKNGQDAPARPGWLQLQIVDSKKRAKYEELNFLLDNDPMLPGQAKRYEATFVTPLEEGEFELVGHLLSAEPQELFRVPIRVDFRQRIQALSASIEVPDGVKPKGNTVLRVRLQSPRRLSSRGELTLLLRFQRVGGDYVWEMDRLPRDLDLELDEGDTTLLEWSITAPWETGAYNLSLEVLDKNSRLRTPLKLAQPARLIVNP